MRRTLSLYLSESFLPSHVGLEMSSVSAWSSYQNNAQIQAISDYNLHADDYAPPAAKTQWLAVFYLCIPTGYALGYIFGGLVAIPLGWRAPFLLEALAMIPFILYCSFAPPIDIRGTKDKGTACPSRVNQVTWDVVLSWLCRKNILVRLTCQKFEHGAFREGDHLRNLRVAP